MKLKMRFLALITAVLLAAPLVPVFPGDAAAVAASPFDRVFDPRGTLPPARDQGGDDVSYAFAVAAAAEIALQTQFGLAQYGISGADLPDLSEQHIRFAMSKAGGNSIGFTASQSAALNLAAYKDPRAAVAAYLTRGKLGGLVLEAHDPYRAGAESRNQSVTAEKLSAFRVGDVIYLPDMPVGTPNLLLSAGGTFNTERQNHIDDLKAAIAQYGAVTGWINGNKTINKETAPGKYWSGPSLSSYGHLKAGDLTATSGNWCVTAVGWDDDYQFADYFEQDGKGNNNAENRPPESGAFIIRNSWGGKAHGEFDDEKDGYFYLSYNDSLLLRNAFALTNIKQVNNDLAPVDVIYEQDPLGQTGVTVSEGGWMANAFTVEQAGQNANAVSLAVAEGGAACDIYVIPFSPDTASVTGIGPMATLTSLIAQGWLGAPAASRTFAGAGYYTVDLNGRVPLGKKGDAVFVLVRYSNCKGIPFHNQNGGVSGMSFRAPTAGDGVSPGMWAELSGQNACVKLIADELDRPRPTGISLSPAGTQTINVGDTVHWSYDLAVSPGIGIEGAQADNTVIWTTSDAAVARVDNGYVTAAGGGTCQISVTSRSGRRTDSRLVYVPPVAVTSLKLNRTEAKLKTNQTVQLSAVFTPSNATVKAIEWVSSHPDIASVSSLGLVQALKPSVDADGNPIAVTVTARSRQYEQEFYEKYGENLPLVEAECALEITIDYVNSIALSRRNINTAVGSVIPLTYKVGPTTAYDTGLTFEAVSGDETVAALSFDHDGKKIEISALKAGKVEYRIRPNTANPAKDPAKAPSALLAITISELADYYVNVDKPIVLTGALVGVKPENYDWKIIDMSDLYDRWTDNDGNIDIEELNLEADELLREAADSDGTDVPVGVTFTVNKNKARIEGSQKGEYRVLISDKNNKDNRQVQSLFVKVPARKVTVWAEADEELTKRPRKKELTVNQNGDAPSGDQVRYAELQLDHAVGPDEASHKKVIWSSSKPGVATVDQYGKVTAVGPGTTIITCKAVADSAKSTFSISVKYNPEAQDIALNKTGPQRLAVGKKLSLRVQFGRTRYISKAVKWESSDPAVAVVTKTGSVKIVGRGEAVVTATVAGGATLSIDVEGIVPVKSVKADAASLKMAPGDTFALNAAVTPPDANYQGLTYVSTKPDIVAVDPDTGVVTALAPGAATIRIRAEVGSARKSVPVRVK